MPTSKVTRVRSEGFSKIMASVLPCKRVGIGFRAGLDVGGQVEEFANLVRREVADGEEIVAVMMSPSRRLGSVVSAWLNPHLKPVLACAAPALSMRHGDLVLRWCWVVKSESRSVRFGLVSSSTSYPTRTQGLFRCRMRRRSTGVASTTTIARRAVDGLLQFLALRLAVAHGRQQVVQVRIFFEGPANGSDGVRPRIDALRRPVLAGGDHAGAVRHFAVGEGGTVLDHEHVLALDGLGIVHRDAAGGLDHAWRWDWPG